ncbi:hypothetical protein B0T26DRAFT_645097 [Lasiosphaeria miniovina]|uniref:Uncharacterized protein n=1 Tax=Lasiosphaeria miniovina TaxID=1954250 RepID=A0AA40ALS5_9PEZI|nr:uncharacterized protein B0T26DRAFT_645097 [Lasiosphaeria miniovina]KAK0718077.1 hypothetical protein B0T26DRAFT_645097 [Lasiosphaeria miniovina]
MVIGLLVIAGIPTTIGVCEALSAQKKADAAAKEKAKFFLTTTVSLDGEEPVECFCVLKGGKLWIDHPAYPMPGHKFLGWYFTYPSEAQHLGMVSTIQDDPPALNWIFVDKDSNMVRHGGRQDTLGGHTIGPWNWSSDEQWLTLEGDAARFVAVEQENRKWAVAWDRDGSIRNGGCDDEDEGGDGDEDESHQPRKRAPIMLHRRMQLGMESRYVKGQGAG